MAQVSVFICEDDALVMSGYQSMLRHEGYSLAGYAYNGVDALEKIPEALPDVVIMDINMPYMDGLSTIRELNKKYDIPFIVITGYNDSDNLEEAASQGVFAFLKKPIDSTNIKNAITIALQKHKREKELREDLRKEQEALRDRKLIERAKGLLMKEFSMEEPEAMEYLQKKSQEKNIKLAVFAKHVIEVYE